MNARVATVLAGLVLGGAALGLPAAAAQEITPVTVTVEQDTRQRLDIPLQAPLRATVAEGGIPPAREFAVFASAENTATAERTQIFDCTPELDPKVPSGVYLCTVYVIRGGTWTFTVFVNELSADPETPPVTLARGTLDFEVVSDVVSEERVAGVSGSPTDVLALWVHVVAAAGWFACVVLLVFLAVPWGRARLSPATVAALERRFDALPKGTWTAAVFVVGTGLYLMLNQTAYETPWSPDAIDQRFTLPYARPYFLSLAVKLAAYAAMLGVTPALISEARRRSQLQSAPKAAAWWVRGSAVLIGAGAPVITFCVTLLKYFHELIEASGAT